MSAPYNAIEVAVSHDEVMADAPNRPAGDFDISIWGIARRKIARTLAVDVNSFGWVRVDARRAGPGGGWVVTYKFMGKGRFVQVTR